MNAALLSTPTIQSKQRRGLGCACGCDTCATQPALGFPDVARIGKGVAVVVVLGVFGYFAYKVFSL